MGLWVRLGIGALALLVQVLLFPRLACDGAGKRWFSGDLSTQQALADRVAKDVLSADARTTYYRSGLSRFDGQSTIATDQMALLGLGQIVLAHPDQAERYLPAMYRAAERLVDPDLLTYAASVYGEHGVVRIDPGEGHAYLGYIALGLGMLRMVDRDNPHAALHDRLIGELGRNLFASPTGLVETYPGETWPPDVAAVAGALGLHARATGIDRSDALASFEERFTRCAIAPSGWLRQHTTKCGVGVPRGSGTAVGAYFLSFSNPALSRRLTDALVADGHQTMLGYGAFREYPPGTKGFGDIDSGPVLFGVSVGATGFGLGATRVSGDRATFLSLHRTTRLFGAPMAHGDQHSFVAGGALGNALLLAMLTARTQP